MRISQNFIAFPIDWRRGDKQNELLFRNLPNAGLGERDVGVGRAEAIQKFEPRIGRHTPLIRYITKIMGLKVCSRSDTFLYGKD